MTFSEFIKNKRLLKQIGIAIIAILLLIILLQNTDVVTFSLLFWSISMSQIVLIVITVLFGFLAGYLTHSLLVRKKKKVEKILSNE